MIVDNNYVGDIMAKNEFICDCNIIHKETVDQILKTMEKDETFNKLADFFNILKDPTRLKIMFVLDKKQVCVCDIANILSMSKSSISHQLSTLRKSGIVKCYKQGKEVYYTLDDDHINKVFEIALEHINHKK